MGTLDPEEESFATQGISNGATLSLLPRLIVGGVGGSPGDERQEMQRDSTVGGEPSSIEDIQIASAQAISHDSLAPSPTSASHTPKEAARVVHAEASPVQAKL